MRPSRSRSTAQLLGSLLRVRLLLRLYHQTAIVSTTSCFSIEGKRGTASELTGSFSQTLRGGLLAILADLLQTSHVGLGLVSLACERKIEGKKGEKRVRGPPGDERGESKLTGGVKSLVSLGGGLLVSLLSDLKEDMGSIVS